MRLLGCAAIGLNPVYWFFLVYVIRHPTWPSIILAILGTAVGAATLQVSGMYCSRFCSAAEVERDERIRHGELTPVTIGSLSGIISESLWHDLASARVETSALWRNEPKAQGNEVYILLYRPKSSAAPWTPGSAFLGSVGLRVAIVRDNPLQAKRPWARFLFLHELAHVSSEGVALQVARWRLLLTMLYSLATILLLAAPFAHPWAGATLILACVLELNNFLRFERLCESYADVSAFAALPAPEDRDRVLALMAVEARGASVVFGENHFHTRLWRSRIAALKRGRKQTAFNPGGGTIFDPSALPFLVASLAVAIFAWVSKAPSGWRFWLYLTWCVACQIAAVILFLVAQYVDAGIRISLNKKILSTPIETTFKNGENEEESVLKKQDLMVRYKHHPI